MPCSGPRYLPAAISASAFFACASATSFVSVMTQRSFGSNCSIRSQIDVRQALGGERLLLDPARQLRDGRKRDVGVASPAAAPASLLAAHERVARRTWSRPRAPGSSASPGATFGSSATLRGPTRRSSSGAIDSPPARRRHLALGGAHRHLRELFRFGERGRRHGGARPPARSRTSAARPASSAAETTALCGSAAARHCRAEHAERSGDQELSTRVHNVTPPGKCQRFCTRTIFTQPLAVAPWTAM